TLQGRSDLTDCPAAVRLPAQAIARNFEKGRRQVSRNGRLRMANDRGGWAMLREGFDQSDAESPSIAGLSTAGADAFGSIVGGMFVATAAGFTDVGKAVAGELDLIADGEDVRGLQAAVDKALAVEAGEGIQDGGQDGAGLFGGERALGKDLREGFFGVLHQDEEQLAAS